MQTRLGMAAMMTALLALGGNAVSAQDRGQGRDDQRRSRDNSQGSQGHDKFDDKDRQTTTDWYNQHKNHPPQGLRNQDRLSSEQESRLRPGATLDPDLRSRAHDAPSDLRRRLPAPSSGHRYVTIGGHVGLIDRNNQVKDVIHLHDDRENR